MESTYIKFKDPGSGVIRKKENFGKRVFKMFLISFIPVGNPAFEGIIDDVGQWLIEFEEGKQYPNREIGLDISQQPIMILPWRKNYGYWIDNNLLLEDFKQRFNAKYISPDEFETHWNQFLRQNGDIE